MVVMTLRQGRTEGYSANKLRKIFGVSRLTLKRWIGYFKEVFPVSNQWRRIKGKIGINVQPDKLPGAIVLFFMKQSLSDESGLINSIRFLSGGFEMV